MGVVTCQISISLDGSVAGPNQSIENPIGEDGMRLHDWVFATASWRRQHGQDGGEDGADSDVAEEVTRGVGAYIMDRTMFGGASGQWGSRMEGLVGRRAVLPLASLRAHQPPPPATFRSRSMSAMR